jgi:hypothetical protein
MVFMSMNSMMTILHKMEVKDYRILWSEPITQEDLDEREQTD